VAAARLRLSFDESEEGQLVGQALVETVDPVVIGAGQAGLATCVVSNQTVFAVTSLAADQATPAELLRLWQSHWRIESLFWVRDAVFREDHATIRTGHAHQVLAAFAIWSSRSSTCGAAATSPPAASTSRAIPMPSSATSNCPQLDFESAVGAVVWRKFHNRAGTVRNPPHYPAARPSECAGGGHQRSESERRSSEKGARDDVRTWAAVILLGAAMVFGFVAQIYGATDTTYEWLITGVAAIIGAIIASGFVGAFTTYGPQYDGLALVPPLIGAVLVAGLADFVTRATVRHEVGS